MYMMVVSLRSFSHTMALTVSERVYIQARVMKSGMEGATPIANGSDRKAGSGKDCCKVGRMPRVVTFYSKMSGMLPRIE